MRMLNIPVILFLMATTAFADQKLPLFGSEASGVVKISPKTEQQASLSAANMCVDAICPSSIKAANRPITQGKLP